MAHSPECPILPPGSVDFDALCAAARKGDDLAEFLAPPAADTAQAEIVVAPASTRQSASNTKSGPAPEAE